MKLDITISLTLAAGGTAGLALGHSHPGPLASYLAVLNALALWRWHDRKDLIGWILGASLGNVTELSADAAGLWIHPTRAVFGVAPGYILLCYPLLWLVVPRMLNFATQARTSTRDVVYALGISAGHCFLCCVSSGSNRSLMAISIGCLAILLTRFHRLTDFIYAGLGAALGLFWEIPCTITGAWRFPAPDIANLIPAWLPFAYAVFFAALNRVRLFASEPLSRRLMAPSPCADPSRQRAKQGKLSRLFPVSRLVIQRYSTWPPKSPSPAKPLPRQYRPRPSEA